MALAALEKLNRVRGRGMGGLFPRFATEWVIKFDSKNLMTAYVITLREVIYKVEARFFVVHSHLQIASKMSNVLLISFTCSAKLCSGFRLALSSSHLAMRVYIDLIFTSTVSLT